MNGYDGELADLKRQVNLLKEQLQGSRHNLRDAATTFLHEWVWQRLEFEVKNNPAQTKQLGQERLSSIKDDVRELQSRMPEIVANTITDNCLRPDEAPSGVFEASAIPARMHQGLRLCAGQLGPILKKHGYISSEALEADWTEIGTDRHGPRVEPKPCAKQLDVRELTPGLTYALNDYMSQTRELANLESRIVETERQKIQQEANDLWDKA